MPRTAAVKAEVAPGPLEIVHEIPPTPIFIYHGFYRSPQELSAVPLEEQRYFLSVEQFQRQLDYLAENRFRVCSVAEYLAGETAREPHHGSTSKQRSVVLTFDDGHLSQYRWAWPMLRERGFSGTFFIVADRVNQAGNMTTGQLRELLRSGMSLGSHGMTHAPLSRLAPAELDRELAGSRGVLEDALGTDIRHLGIPGGFVNRFVLERAAAAGYHSVCTSIPGLARPAFSLRRLSMVSLTSLATFANLANGRVFELCKRRAAYWLLQSVKRVIGVNNYEKACGKLVASKAETHPAARAAGVGNR